MKILKETLSKQQRKIELYGNDTNNQILVIGVFHGDEPQGDYLINEYIKFNRNSNLLFIPCLNPDGMALNTRQNSNNVDLNRNFPTKNWIINEDKNYFGGNEPASEIETKFVIDVINTYKPKIILTLHAPYCVVNYDGEAKEISTKISEIINYPVEEDIGYATPGSFGTYAGKEKGIPTITLELDETIDVQELIKPVHKIFDYLSRL